MLHQIVILSCLIILLIIYNYILLITTFIYIDIFVMKNMAGIDLSDLTEAQRKMCVKLLAANNVEFI